MCKLVDAIEGVSVAADNLTRACAREGAQVDSAPNHVGVGNSLRRAFRSASLTPNDMLSTLGKMK